MIRVNEIMIGNYIRDVWSDNGFFKVTELRKDKVFYGNCFKAEYENIRPIPLTEDILLKCGFEKESMNEHTDYYNLHPLHIFYNVANGFEYFHSQFGGKFIKITSLHQLQNLYFALVGKELDVKL